jgi:predicted dinucleotide-binding enzyme
MNTAIIGVGNICGSLARDLVNGGERVVLAAHNESNAQALAKELGELASATSVEKAITEADVVVFAVWLDTIKELIAEYGDLLKGKVVVDPSNPIAIDDKGEVIRDVAERAALLVAVRGQTIRNGGSK